MNGENVVLLGQEEYLNLNTGEVKTLDLLCNVDARDVNFHKVWIIELLEKLECISSKKCCIFYYLLKKANRVNVAKVTQRKIARDLECSTKTVTQTLQLLQKQNLIKLKQEGEYVINPSLIYKGSKQNRLIALNYYSTI